MTSRKRSKADDLKAFVTTAPAPVIESNKISTEFRKLVSKIDKIYQKSSPVKGSKNDRRDLKISELSPEDLDDVLALIEDTVVKRKTTANPENAFAANSFPSTDLSFNVEVDEDDDEVQIDPTEFDERIVNQIPTLSRERGVTRYRPELILLTDYEYSTPGTPAAEMLDLQINSRYVRSDAVESLIKELDQDPESESAKILQRLRDKFNTDLEQILNEVNFLKSFFETRQKLEAAISIISDQDSLVSQCQKLRDTRIKDNKMLEGIEDLQESKSLNDFLVQDLGFNPDHVRSKTGTTAFLQVLSDFYQNVMQIYTYSNPAIEQEEERFDLSDDYEIIRKQRSQFRKAWAQKFYSGRSKPFVPTDHQDMGLWRNRRASSYRTPGDLANAVSQFARFLANEMTISSGLAKPDIIAVLSEDFNESDTGDIFDGIIGIPRGSSMDLTNYRQKPNSLTALASQRSSLGGRNSRTFPFETTPLPNNRQNNLTGKSAYVDSITKNKTTNIDLAPARILQTALNDKTEVAYDTLSTLLGLDGTGVFAQEIVNDIISSIAKLVGILNPSDNVETFDAGMAVQLAFLIWTSRHEEGLNTAAALILQVIQLKALKRFDSGTSTAFSLERMTTLDEAEILKELKRAPWTRDKLSDDVKDGSTPLGRYYFESIYARAISSWIGQKFPNAETIYNLDVDTTDDPFQVRIRYSDSAATNYVQAAIVSSNSIFSEILGIVEKIDAKILERGNPYRSNSAQGTRFNNISPSSIIASILTIYGMILQKTTNYFGFHPSYGVKGEAATRQFYVHIDKQPILELQDSLQKFQQGGVDALDPQSQLSLFLRALSRIFNKDLSINLNSTEIIRSASTNITKRFGDIANLVDPEGPNSLSMNSIFGEDNAKQKLTVVDEPQLALAINSLQNYLQFKTEESPVFFSTDLIDSTTRKALSKFGRLNRRLPNGGMLSLNGSTAKNVKMITVGLPAGLSNFINQKTRQEIKAGTGLQKDIININVYMKNLNYDFLVFQPMTFAFELSRFFKKINEIPENDQPNFADIVQQFAVTRDIQVNRNPQILESIGFDLAGAETYQYSNATMSEVITNTVTSHFCHLYLKLLTGIDPCESTFLYLAGEENKSLDSSDLAEFNALVQGHVSSIAPGLTLDQVALQNPQMRDVVRRIKTGKKTAGVLKEVRSEEPAISRDNNVRLSEDLVSLSKLVSPQSALTSPGILRKKALSPKVFERVFTILVDPELFSIDIAKTVRENRQGRVSLRNLRRTGILTNDGRRFSDYAKNRNKASLNQFFITVSRREQ